MVRRYKMKKLIYVVKNDKHELWSISYEPTFTG